MSLAARVVQRPSGRTVPLQPSAPKRDPQRRLRTVAQPAARRRPKLVYAFAALGVALVIGVIQIGLSLAITQDSFTLASLSSQQRELTLQTHALQEELTGLGSPQVLASAAAGLGMVVAGSPSYLRLSDGAIFGAGTGADWSSTIDPNGAGAVSNALIPPPVVEPPVTEGEPGTGQPATELPPAITDGLPSPTTR